MVIVNELQRIRGQAVRGDWCEVEPIYCCFFLAASQSWRARSQQTAEQQIRKFPISHPILTSSPVTAALGVENGRTESLREEPSPESNDLAASRLRTRETNISPCVGLAPSLNMRTRKKEQLLYYTAVIAHGF